MQVAPPVSDPLPTAEVKPGAKHFHIPYLDGLRGISVLWVVLGHAAKGYPLPEAIRYLFGNAVLGVQVFFVISGYLITTLLVREREKTGTINRKAFYLRRIARIFPAFYTYIAVIAVLAVLGIARVNLPQILSAASFTWNYNDAYLPSYAGTDTRVLSHFWTLSLEEQYYIVWPTVMLVFGLAMRKWIVWLLVLAPFLRIATYALFPSLRGSINAMFHTGYDPILAGSLTAILMHQGLPQWLQNLVQKRWTPFALIGGLLVLEPLLNRVPASFVIEYTLVGIFVSLLLVWLLTGPKTVVQRALENKVLVWFGLISYSLYLWHVPFLRLNANGHYFFSPFIAVPLGILAAYVSYTFVEQPTRRYLRRRWSL